MSDHKHRERLGERLGDRLRPGRAKTHAEGPRRPGEGGADEEVENPETEMPEPNEEVPEHEPRAPYPGSTPVGRYATGVERPYREVVAGPPTEAPSEPEPEAEAEAEAEAEEQKQEAEPETAAHSRF